jgi:hypothetical protein
MSARLTEHHLARRGEQLPPVDETLMLDYVYTGNGTFARGRRDGLEVCMPVALYQARGLRRSFPYLQWGYPRLPARFMERMLSISRDRCATGIREALFHFSFDKSGRLQSYGPGSKVLDFHQGWHMEFPDQRGREDRVELVNKGLGTSEERAVIEVHSHPTDRAYFSDDDDRDEGGMSFRVYCIIGHIFNRPQVRARIGLFGHFYECPAAEFFELPEGFVDCVEG